MIHNRCRTSSNNSTDFTQTKAQVDPFNLNLKKEYNVNLWKSHNVKGVRVKPRKPCPICDI